ncbi:MULTISPECIES: RHS repeat domain-containing protein [Pseudomonas]|uniref:Type IV secretion protein Rhs n=1 Tax=Pseudomonas aphyarum TaxID=2942629 RepID=A0ABT5PUX5_9PSED|nr:RHS repeat-associated core domain-containing protein [Pseudomonas aphyarum]MDD0968104.1 type IV secretion protein Rhs [Pseudomonas aphyarum]MDD1127564.1 type IV secretion protein Rhs [Pseudomonas aphyarum]
MSYQASDFVSSNAFNFSDFVSGGVDPRTGIYTCALKLGTVRSADLNGPSFNLALGFNPLNTRNAGYGTGWSLSSSRYDLRSKVMTLATGETYKASETSNALLFREMKLESAKVLKVGTGLYEVRYKDGRREELKVHGATNVAVPVRIFAANGASINLKYTTFNEQPMLIEIADAKRVLLNVSRTAGRLTMTQNPGTPSSAEFSMTFKNDRVTAIGLPVGRGWDLQYEVIDGISYLRRVDSPLGAVEIIRYKQVGHLLPTLEGVQSLPYVIAHDIFARQGQPKVVKTYAYSDHNYLGHGVPSDPVDDGDPLYRAPGSYQYSSTERLIVGEKTHTRINRTYNKFHLLVSEVTISGESVASVSTEYHGDVNKPFTEQPAQFQMPKAQTRSYENSATKNKRTEVSTTEFDSAGNLVKQVQANGVTTQYEYYPDIESVDCPKDPLGFIRFLKSKTVVPADGGGASTVTRYRYGLHPALEGATLASVVPVQESFFERVDGGEILRSKVDLTYVNTPENPATHSLLQQQSVTRNAKVTRIEYSYVPDATTRVLKKTVHGFDGTTSSTEHTLSTLSGLMISERDADEGVTEFEYDKLGRRLRKTLAPGTAHTSSTHWRYEAAKGNEPATVITSDSSGGMQKITYDALGRITEVQEKDCDNPDSQGQFPMRAIYTAVHDSTGRPFEVTHRDWGEGLVREVKSEFLYDDWGQVKETRHGDGRVEHSEFDPISRQQKSWQQGLGKTVTVVNAFGKPDSVEIFDLKDLSLGKTVNEYDGLGRTLSQTDPAGNTTRYEYDVFDRMVRTILPDGHAVETTFAAHSTDELPVEIKVAGLQLGQQTFDGLNRVIESSVGGRKSVIRYEAGRSQPKSHTNPAGQKTEFVHAPEHGGQLTERKAVNKGDDEGLVTRFTYDGLNGKTKSCIEQGRERHFEYFPSGRLKSETTRYGEQRKTVSHTYSFAGLPLTYVDVLGTKHTTEYDTWGRRTSFRQGSVQAGFFYDKRGLLEKIETRDTSSGRLLTTRLAYDDIGREVTRSYEAKGLPTQTLTSSYTMGGKLAQKVLKRGTFVLRDERFTYDVRGRLSQYDCAGSQRPKDPYGKEIVQQKFTFDALDNILSLQTTFPQGINVTTFSFSQIDPAQLVGVTHSHADYPAPVTLEYDADGRMIKDDQARTLAYDAFGRLIQVSNARGEVVRGYHYDGFDRLVELSQPRMLDVQRYYHNASVSSEIRDKDSRSIVRNGGLVLGQQQSGADAGSRIFGTDQQQSVLTQLHGEQWEDNAYSPYGHRQAEGGFFSLAGFNGEQLDAVTGLYLLGNGYRAYSPTLMRFTSPDSMSPFGAGGLNTYAYCIGDPVNRVDPTGHVSWQSIAGIALGVIGIAASIVTLGAATPLALFAMGLGIASGVAGIGSELANELAPQSQVGAILGWISLGLGIASAAAGVLAVRQAVAQSIRPRPYLLKLADVVDEPPARIVEMEYATFGMPFKNKAAGAAARVEPPANWTVVEDIGAHDYIEAGRRGNAQRAKYAEYKAEITGHNTHPREAAKVFPTALYENYPNYKSFDPKGVHKDFMHAHIRLTYEHRAFFLVNDNTKQIIIKQIGNHEPKW